MLYAIRDHLRQILITLAVIAVVALALVAVMKLANLGNEPKEPTPVDRLYVTVESQAPGWNSATSTPAIMKVTGTDEAGEAVDYFHAVTGNGTDEIELEPGSYEVTYISPVNDDGSIYEAPSPTSFDTAASDRGLVKLDAAYANVSAAKVTEEQANKLLADIEEATTFGDETLTDQKGEEIVSHAKLYLTAAVAGNGNVSRSSKWDNPELNWSDSENVRTADEVEGASKADGAQADATTTSTGTGAGVEGSSAVRQTADAVLAAASQTATSVPATQQAAERKWVEPVYEEEPKYEPAWVDDGDGTGHYEMQQSGTEKKLKTPGHYE